MSHHLTQIYEVNELYQDNLDHFINLKASIDK